MTENHPSSSFPSLAPPQFDGGLCVEGEGTALSQRCSAALQLCCCEGGNDARAVLLALRLLVGLQLFLTSSRCCPHASFDEPSTIHNRNSPNTRRFRNPFLLFSRSVSRSVFLSLSLAFFFIPALLPLSVFCMSPPPSLVHLTLVTAVHHIHRFSDLSSVPDHLVLHLFQKILAAGKLTDYVLRMFVATGNDEVLQLVKALRIRPVTKPILPTRCSDKEF